jgi:hypothetical protein
VSPSIRTEEVHKMFGEFTDEKSTPTFATLTQQHASLLDVVQSLEDDYEGDPIANLWLSR